MGGVVVGVVEWWSRGAIWLTIYCNSIVNGYKIWSKADECACPSVSMKPNSRVLGGNSNHMFGVHDIRPGESRRPTRGMLRGGLCIWLAKAPGIPPADGNIVDRLLYPQPFFIIMAPQQALASTIDSNKPLVA